MLSWRKNKSVVVTQIWHLKTAAGISYAHSKAVAGEHRPKHAIANKQLLNFNTNCRATDKHRNR